MPFFLILFCMLQTLCGAQAIEKDSVYQDRNGNTIFAHFANGQPSGTWTIKHEKGNFESGNVIWLPHQIQDAVVNYSWGSPIGKWYHYEKDSSLRYITETTYAHHFKTVHQKGYYVVEGKPTFDYYRITKHTWLDSIRIRCREDSAVISFRKENFYRSIFKEYSIENNSTVLREKTVRNWFKWRTKGYDANGRLINKKKNIFHSPNQLHKKYNPEKSRLHRPAKEIIYTKRGLW
jgi:hypothetical protein